MKTLKRFSLMLLVLALVLSLSVSALAAEPTGSITIHDNASSGGTVAGKTFSAYKILDAAFVDGDPRKGTAYTVPDAMADFFAERYTLVKTAPDFSETVVEKIRGEADPYLFAAEALAKAKDAQIVPAARTAGDQDSQVVIDGLPFGYYIVAEDRTVSQGDPVPLSLLMVDTAGTVNVDLKMDQPDIDKLIVDADDGAGKGTAGDVGQAITFQLTTKVPEMEGYKSYDYIVHDTFSKGLTYIPASLEITLDGAALDAETDYTVNFRAPDLTITFLNMIGRKADAGKPIVITYKATLNEAALTTVREENEVYLEYSNDPYGTTTGDSTRKKTYVYDFDIVIDKYAEGQDPEDKTKKLAGAEFVLYKMSGEDRTYYKVDAEKNVTWVPELENATKVTTTDTGSACFTGLDTGTYSLQEIKAPLGYNKLTADAKVEITARYNPDGTLFASEAITTDEMPQYHITASIANKTGSVLPRTGGIGTTVFYVVGGTLVVMALVLLITKKKMNSAER